MQSPHECCQSERSVSGPLPTLAHQPAWCLCCSAEVALQWPQHPAAKQLHWEGQQPCGEHLLVHIMWRAPIKCGEHLLVHDESMGVGEVLLVTFQISGEAQREFDFELNIDLTNQPRTQTLTLYTLV